MGKMKTHRGAAKRLSVTGTGKVKRSHAYAGHKFLSKTPKRKRNLRQSTLVSGAEQRRIKRLIPYM